MFCVVNIILLLLVRYVFIAFLQLTIRSRWELVLKDIVAVITVVAVYYVYLCVYISTVLWDIGLLWGFIVRPLLLMVRGSPLNAPIVYNHGTNILCARSIIRELNRLHL